MGRDSMREFFERLGHTIISSPSATWYDVQKGVLLSFPYYKLVKPSEQELQDLVRMHKLRAIRYPTVQNGFGFVSNIVINTDTQYDFGSLHQKARNQTRRALESCSVKQIDFEYLREHGMPLNIETAQRQGRESQYADAGYWAKYCAAAGSVDGVSAWGAFVGDRLASFLIAIKVDDWVEWIVNHSSTELRGKYPNNALAFTVAQHFFQSEKSAGICYGLGSLESTPDLDHFKVRMGWRLEPVKQRLVFSRKLSLASSLATEPVLKLLGKVFPRSYLVRKTSAMFRLYRNQTAELPQGADGTQDCEE